ncbi:hypothetical protein [Sulfurospirillum sp. hDNRA2]|uniref:hypothetical protein n=1 Tax=Sulfurospirillum sp. hDNRA2 TaxID=3237298 RepID=UPI0020B86171|nr:hypothetical protein [Sulfurospirillum sp. DNRA8]MCP3652601.1 hypothetical protein [Sulfurospirillum sp. DNRA8]MCR1811452.1 hypothetical protein [Sulfurospirillum sp. DNRA8]
MNGFKFVQTIKELFGFMPQNAESTQKKSIKELLRKLKFRRILLKQELKNETDLLKRESIRDSIKILKKQIKKGKDLVDD